MADIGVKETLCSSCAHMNVCAYMQDYLDILKAVENIHVVKDAHDGKITSKKAINYDFVSKIFVGCKYYKNWTGTYRSGKEESDLIF